MAPLSVASWNINSVRAREERLLNWLADNPVDVLCLQETKTTDDQFPIRGVAELGYHASVSGQKSYNGVAILSKTALDGAQRGISPAIDDGQARLIGGSVDGVHVYSAYIPNGGGGDEKYGYKINWLEGLLSHLTAHHTPDEALLICGDFNIARDDRDVYDTAFWESTPLYNEEMRQLFQRLLDWGLVDTFRLHCDAPEKYSWWDYRQLAFPLNKGLRIDYILATQALAECCVDARIDRNGRKGKKPSDHAPVVAVFERGL